MREEEEDLCGEVTSIVTKKEDVYKRTHERRRTAAFDIRYIVAFRSLSRDGSFFRGSFRTRVRNLHVNDTQARYVHAYHAGGLGVLNAL